MEEDKEFEGAQNAERAKEKADSRPTRFTNRVKPEHRDEDDKSIDRSKQSKEEALAKVEQERRGPGRP
ncbi:MAG TPA: hypothetical protein PKZ32_12770 [Candidatus Melainabacteria bacterium]|nr:hypothetical protein [Candidatus Melainabacteria bacterium]